MSKAYKKSLKTRWPLQDRKVLLFLSFPAERFDLSSSPTYKKYLPLPNQLHFWIEHVQSIANVKINLKSRRQQQRRIAVFSNSVGRKVRLNDPVPFFKNTFT